MADRIERPAEMNPAKVRARAMLLLARVRSTCVSHAAHQQLQDAGVAAPVAGVSRLPVGATSGSIELTTNVRLRPPRRIVRRRRC
jgi:hypothetical protein